MAKSEKLVKADRTSKINNAVSIFAKPSIPALRSRKLNPHQYKYNIDQLPTDKDSKHFGR